MKSKYLFLIVTIVLYGVSIPMDMILSGLGPTLIIMALSLICGIGCRFSYDDRILDIGWGLLVGSGVSIVLFFITLLIIVNTVHVF